MFEPVREDGTATQLAGALLAVWRNRWVRRLMLFVMILIIAGFGIWTWFWRATLDETCRVVDVPPLGFEDFMALRERKNVYQRSREVYPWLTVTPEEFTYLMAEHRGLSVEVKAEGDIVDVHAGLPVSGGCYNLHVRGHAKIEAGVLSMSPEFFQVGEYDLSWFMGGLYFEIRPADIQDPDIAKMLSNTRAMRVESGALHLRLKDRATNWSFRDQ